MQMVEKMNTIKTGLTEALPLAIAIAAYGLSYGVLAIQVKFSWLDTLIMSALVFSGSVQMITVAMLAAGGSLTSIVFTSVLLNLRNLLYGAALAEGLAPAKKWKWLLAFGVSDEPFVLASSRFKNHGPDPLYFGIVAGTFYLAWILSSLTGALIGNQIDPQRWGLDLAFPITFTALLLPGLKDHPAIATAIAAAVIALGLEYLWPGNELTIIISGVFAPFAGLYLSRRA